MAPEPPWVLMEGPFDTAVVAVQPLTGDTLSMRRGSGQAARYAPDEAAGVWRHGEGVLGEHGTHHDLVRRG